MLGRSLTYADFEWPLPQKCYGTCKASPHGWKKWFPCDLPCSHYSGKSAPAECMTHGRYKNSRLAFSAASGEDCKNCKKAQWHKNGTCWPTRTPKRMFATKKLVATEF